MRTCPVWKRRSTRLLPHVSDLQTHPRVKARYVVGLDRTAESHLSRDKDVARILDNPQSGTLSPATPYSEAQQALLKSEFDRCWPWLEEAMAHGGNLHSRDSLWSMLIYARAHLWPESDAAAVTCFQTFPRAVVCELWLAGGNLQTILANEPRVADWARRSGATHLQIDGRPGWARALERQGWQRTATTIMRRIKS